MGRTRVFPAGTAERVAALMKQVADKGADQRLQCIWLSLQGQSPTQIAGGLGWRPGSVRRVQDRYLANGEVALVGQPRGGRRGAFEERHSSVTRHRSAYFRWLRSHSSRPPRSQVAILATCSP
jgi:hypothetical protein